MERKPTKKMTDQCEHRNLIWIGCTTGDNPVPIYTCEECERDFIAKAYEEIDV